MLTVCSDAPFSAEASKQTSLPAGGAAGEREDSKEKVPRVPLPEVAVTVPPASRRPAESDSLRLEGRLEDVGRAGDLEGARHHVERRRALDEDRRRDRLIVGAGARRPAAAHRERRAVHLDEHTPADGGKLRQGVDRAEPRPGGRRRLPKGAGEIDRGHAGADRKASQGRAGRDRRRHADGLLPGRGPESSALTAAPAGAVVAATRR